MGWLYNRFHSLIDKDSEQKKATMEEFQTQITVLDDAVDTLNREVRSIKQNRVQVTRVLDEALVAIRKEFNQE